MKIEITNAVAVDSPQKMNSVTFSAAHYYLPGDVVIRIKADNRWWMRLWCFLLLRPAPVIKETFKIASVESSTEMTINQ